jgi:hypothetical protein
MTSMMETAARALFDAWVRLSAVPEYAAEPYWLAYKDHYAELVRAALEAIREPSEEVAAVAKYDEYDWAARNFTAMIDVILNEETT